MSFELLLVTGLLFGIGLGFCVQRAGLCFAHGLGEIFMGRGKRIFRFFLVIFIITATGFWLSGLVNPALGQKTVGQIRGFGLYNLLAGMLFGAGMLLNGGCILGTLRQMGEGNLLFMVVTASLIPGMALVVYVLDPILEPGYETRNVLLCQVLGIPAVYVTAALVIAAAVGYMTIRRRRTR